MDWLRSRNGMITTAVLVGLIFLAGIIAAVNCGGDDDDDPASPAETPATATTSAAVTPEPASITFMAGFRPQANLPFVAVYAAQEMGFFAEEGLEVEIRHSGGGDEHIQLLLGDQVDFTTHLASSVLQQRTQDPVLPIVSFVLWGQRSPSGMVALAESGIDSIEDFVGNRYGYKQTVTPEYLATLAAEGVDRSGIEEISVGFDPSVLVNGQVDVLAVFLNNEPDVLRNTFGVEVNVFDPYDYGVETLGLTYVATEETVAERPDIVERFTRATLRGAQWAIENEDEAITIVLDYMDADEDQREHQLFLFREDVRQAQSAVTEELGLGAMTLEQWQKNADVLFEYDVVDSEPDAEAAFTMEFIEAARE